MLEKSLLSPVTKSALTLVHKTILNSDDSKIKSISEQLFFRLVVKLNNDKNFAQTVDFVILSGTLDKSISDLVEPDSGMDKALFENALSLIEKGVEEFFLLSNDEQFSSERRNELYHLRSNIADKIKAMDSNFEVFESHESAGYSDNFSVYRVEYGELKMYIKVDGYNSTVVMSDYNGENEFGRRREITDQIGLEAMLMSVLKSA